MIAKPLVWKQIGSVQAWESNTNGTKYVYGRDMTGCISTINGVCTDCTTLDAAKAACEAHHQEAVARMLTPEARWILRESYTSVPVLDADREAIALLDRIAAESEN